MSNEIVNAFRQVFETLQEHDRRIAGSEMRGKVTEVDTDKALVRVAIGKDADGNDVLSPWVPYKQTAGAMKFHNPPSVGQVMAVRSETGDIEQGLAEPFRWNDNNQAPSKAGNEHVLTLGSVTVTVTGDKVRIQVGGAYLELTAGGLTAKTPQVDWTQ